MTAERVAILDYLRHISQRRNPFRTSTLAAVRARDVGASGKSLLKSRTDIMDNLATTHATV